MTEINLRTFNCTVGADKEDDFMDKLEAVCKIYAGPSYRFNYDVESDNDEDCELLEVSFRYFEANIDEEDDEAFIDQLESVCKEFCGNSYYIQP